jgi:hypothetical protein
MHDAGEDHHDVEELVMREDTGGQARAAVDEEP